MRVFFFLALGFAQMTGTDRFPERRCRAFSGCCRYWSSGSRSLGEQTSCIWWVVALVQ